MAATYLYEAPVLDVLSVEPGAGPVAGGVQVVILGRGFQVGAGVTFDGLAATLITIENSQRISCTVPAHAAGAVDVVVTNPDTTAADFPGGFTYQAATVSHALTYRTPANTAASRMRTDNAPQITQSLGQPSQFTFTADDEPAGGQQVELRSHGVVLFRGTVTNKVERTDGKERRQVWDVEATDFAHLLGRIHPIGEWAAISGTTVITDLLADAPGFSAAGVEGGLPPVTLSLDGTTDLWAACLDVANRCGAKAFLDGFTVYAFTVASILPGLTAVTEANPDLLWPDDGSQAITIEWDYASIHNRVKVRGAEGITAELDDGESIRRYGVAAFVVNDNTLTTQAELIARAQSVLASDAYPIPIAHYATRDVHTRVGASVAITIARPAIDGVFVVHTVAIDQLASPTGARPRFVVTAKPVTASFRPRGDLVGLLQSAIDLNANAAKQPRLDGDVVSTPGGRTTIPPESITAAQLAGCIDSDKLAPSGVVPGAYGDSAHLAGFIVDAAGRLTAAATDPVAVAKTDGSQPYTADQPMGGHALTDVGAPAAPGDATNKAYVDAAIAAAVPSGVILADGTIPFAGDQSMGGHTLEDVEDPLAPQDAATKAYVDAAVASGGGTPASGEIPTGAIDGVNVVFTTAADYAGLRVYKNGQRLTLGDDYTETAADEFTLAVAPHVGDVILVDYGDSTGGGGTSFTTGDGLALAAGVLDLVLDGASLTKGATGLKVTPTTPLTTGDGLVLASSVLDLVLDGASLTKTGAGLKVTTPAAAAGALVLLGSYTAAASASLPIVTRNAAGQSGAIFQADYDEYMIDLVGILPASNDVNTRLRCSTNGGASYDAGANYAQTFSWQATNNSTAQGGATGNTYMDMGGNVQSAATGGIHGSYRFFDPLSATAHKTIIGRSSFLHTTIGRMGWDRALHYLIATPVNAVALDMVAATGGAAVNIASGSVRVYGIAK